MATYLLNTGQKYSHKYAQNGLSHLNSNIYKIKCPFLIKWKKPEIQGLVLPLTTTARCCSLVVPCGNAQSQSLSSLQSDAMFCKSL